MFWLLKKLISLALLALLILFLLNLDYHGKPVRDSRQGFLKAPLVQSLYQSAKIKALGYLQKDLQTEPLDNKISDEERQKLDELLHKENQQK